MKNPKSKKILYHLLLTPEEEKIILKSMGNIPNIAWIIIKKAFKRNDFRKE